MSKGENTGKARSRKPPSLLEAALDYGRQGWPVFPLKPDKKPYTEHGFKDASTDVQQITSWWSKYPNAMIGLACGQVSGVFVVDLDRKEPDKDGVATWDALTANNGGAPKTRRAITPSTGQHVYFKYLDGIRNIPLNTLGPGLEIKGEGGYVVLPPSKNADGSYQWVEGGAVAETPQWFINQLQEYRNRKSKSHSGGESSNKEPADPNRVKAALGVIDPDITYRTWFEIGCALFRGLGSELGFKFWDEWSSKGTKYIAHEMAAKWNSIVAGDYEYNIGTLFHHANEANPNWWQTDGLTEEQLAEIQRLAALPRAQYEMERREAAKKLHMRAGVLDEFVAKFRPRDAQAQGQGTPLELPEIEPWTEAVDGEALVADMEAAHRRHVSFSETQALAVSLWELHAHAREAADHFPRLHIDSPAKRCGKTTLLKTVAAIVPKPLTTEHISPSALFRIVEKYGPTLLIDEVDTFLKDNDDMLRLLNGGYERAGLVYINVPAGDSWEPRGFRVAGPTVIAGIGTIPETLEDRSITIHLRRRLVGEKIERLRHNAMNHLKILGRRAARWVADNLTTLTNADPELSEKLNDRAQDNWRPLIAIADAISPELGQRARAAALNIEVEEALDDDDNASIMMLTDVAAIVEEVLANDKKYGKPPSKHISSQNLVNDLCALEGRPWNEWRKGRPITSNSIARLLKSFGIRPRTIRVDAKGEASSTVKGYLFTPILEAKKRYIDKESEPEVDLTPEEKKT